MAFPWVFESNFELGTNADWDSESDTGAKLDFPHYSQLAAIPGLPMPWSGAYCARVVMGDTNDHTVTEGDIDIADAATRHFRFMFYAHNDVTATADDTFNIFELQQAGGTIECSLGMRLTAATNLLEIGIGDGVAPTSFVTFTRGRWTAIEWSVLISTAGAGTSTLLVDGASVVALTSQTHAAAVGQGVLGTQNTLSTTTGTLLFKDFVMDDARVFPPAMRYSRSPLLTKSGHAFVGPGYVDSANLYSGAGTDCVLSLYDTDTGNTDDAGKLRVELKNTANSQLVGTNKTSPVYFERGCFVSMSGTTPRAQLDIRPYGAWGGDGAIRNYGLRRKTTPRNE